MILWVFFVFSTLYIQMRFSAVFLSQHGNILHLSFYSVTAQNHLIYPWGSDCWRFCGWFFFYFFFLNKTLSKNKIALHLNVVLSVLHSDRSNLTFHWATSMSMSKANDSWDGLNEGNCLVAIGCVFIFKDHKKLLFFWQWCNTPYWKFLFLSFRCYIYWWGKLSFIWTVFTEPWHAEFFVIQVVSPGSFQCYCTTCGHLSEGWLLWLSSVSRVNIKWYFLYVKCVKWHQRHV